MNTGGAQDKREVKTSKYVYRYSTFQKQNITR